MDFQELAELFMNNPKKLGIVIPCFNEEDALHETASQLIALLTRMREMQLVSEDSAIFFIDDGSKDDTWSIIERLSISQSCVCGIRLTRNRGHQNALLCGLSLAPGDMLISIDADLQDDITVIPKMVRLYYSGNEIVYGVRGRRDLDSFFKRITAEGYYKIMASLGIDVVFNSADFRLLGRRALDALSQYHEVNLFLRGIIPMLGFRSEIVAYDRAERIAGESKYPLSKMIALAWQGITSFSAAPLRMVAMLGGLLSGLSVMLGLWAVYTALLTDNAVPGWASTVVPLYLLGGLQMLSLGVVGEYVAKIYLEAKRRPRFHVESLVGTAFHNR